MIEEVRSTGCWLAGDSSSPSRCGVALRATGYGCSEALAHLPLPTAGRGCWRRTTHTTLLHTDDGGRTRRDTRRCKQKEEPQWACVKQPSSALATMRGVQNVPKDDAVFCVRGSREGAMV